MSPAGIAVAMDLPALGGGAPPSGPTQPSGLEALQLALSLADTRTTELGIQLLQQLASNSAPASAYLPTEAAGEANSADDLSGGSSGMSGDDEASGMPDAGASGSLPAGVPALSGGGGGRSGRVAARTPDQRLHATKEKNRKAQQRFRQRQKEKMTWLELEVKRLTAENARLTAMLHQSAAEAVAATAGATASGVAAMVATASVAPVVSRAATTSGGAGGATTQGPPSPLAPAQPAPVATFAFAPLASVLMPEASDPATGPPTAAPTTTTVTLSASPQPLPSFEEQHDELMGLLEMLPGLDVTAADAYLQAWMVMPEPTRACHYRTLSRRATAGRSADALSWVLTAARQVAAASSTAP